MVREATAEQAWRPSLQCETRASFIRATPGGESLLASRRSSGHNSAALNAITALGKRLGAGAKTSAMFEQEGRANNTAVTLLPFQVQTAYVRRARRSS